jgi:hypothetical integral membrane protein (TIGR02206 family)
VLAIFVAGVAGLLAIGPGLRGTAAEPRVSRTLAWLTLAFGLAGTVTDLVPFTARHSLPLQICDLAWIAVGWALLAPRPLPLALTYYWGLTLSLQALVQPTLTEPFPEPDFFAFWGKHLLIVWGAVQVCLVLRRGPDWAAYRTAVAWTAGWLVVVLGVNAALGSNYGYVSGRPSERTVLDLLGPWPLSLVAEIVIVAGGWALLTLPWTGRPRRRVS